PFHHGTFVSCPTVKVEAVKVSEAVSTQRYQVHWESEAASTEPTCGFDNVQVGRPSKPDEFLRTDAATSQFLQECAKRRWKSNAKSLLGRVDFSFWHFSYEIRFFARQELFEKICVCAHGHSPNDVHNSLMPLQLAPSANLITSCLPSDRSDQQEPF